MQDDALDYLKKHKNKWMTSSEVAKGIGLSKGAAIRSLAGLSMRGWIEKRELNARRFIYRYN